MCVLSFSPWQIQFHMCPNKVQQDKKTHFTNINTSLQMYCSVDAVCATSTSLCVCFTAGVYVYIGSAVKSQ